MSGQFFIAASYTFKTSKSQQKGKKLKYQLAPLRSDFFSCQTSKYFKYNKECILVP
jgi:hypothetical protein